jgi:hypothetical protein
VEPNGEKILDAFHDRAMAASQRAVEPAATVETRRLQRAVDQLTLGVTATLLLAMRGVLPMVLGARIWRNRNR